MTEEDAKTKMCFQAATFAGSQQIADGPGPLCIGSACMAWRWTLAPWEIGGGEDYSFVKATINWGDGRKTTVASGKREADGFCGLAGKP